MNPIGLQESENAVDADLPQENRTSSVVGFGLRSICARIAYEFVRCDPISIPATPDCLHESTVFALVDH